VAIKRSVPSLASNTGFWHNEVVGREKVGRITTGGVVRPSIQPEDRHNPSHFQGFPDWHLRKQAQNTTFGPSPYPLRTPPVFASSLIADSYKI
jgi:hypothetical protein